MLTDKEIEEITEDKLKFTPFSEALKEIILSSGTPLTIGLHGKWGSGKTSLMQMTQNSLNLDNNDTIKTLWFNAWKFDKSHDLRVALIQSILREIELSEEELSSKEKIKRVFNILREILGEEELSSKEKIRSIYNRTKEHSFKKKVKDFSKRVNWMGLGMVTINQFLIRSMSFKELNEPLLKNTGKISQKSLELIGDFEKRFNEIIHEYVGNDGKFVIFIDDLDRCVPEKAVYILETIKLFLDAPHSVFVIGADTNVIESEISQKYPGISEDWGSRYLDKIIQIPFFLPPLREEVILDEFILKLPIDEEIKQHKEIIVDVGVNPRTIKRLINQIELQNILITKQEIKIEMEILIKLNVLNFIDSEFYNNLVETYLESKMNLAVILIEDNKAEKNEKLDEVKPTEKSFDRYLNNKKLMKVLRKAPSLKNVELEDYFHLVKSMNSSKNDKIDYVLIGNSFEDSGDFEEAMKSYDTAIELDPTDARAWLNKGNALISLKYYLEAMKSYDKAIELDPNYANAWVGKGFALSFLNRDFESLECFNRAIVLDPNNVEAWINKGNTLSNLGKHDEAIKTYDTAIELDPKDPRALFNKAKTLESLGMHDEALNNYDKTLELYPNNAWVWLNKAETLESLGRFDEAEKAYKKAFKLDPSLKK